MRCPRTMGRFRFSALPLGLSAYGSGLLAGLGYPWGTGWVFLLLVMVGRGRVTLFLVLFFLGGAASGLREHRLESFLRRPPEGVVLLEGRVVDVYEGRIRLQLADRTASHIDVTLPFGWVPGRIAEGDDLLIMAHWRTPLPALNPGSPDPVAWARAADVRAQADDVSHVLRVKRTPRGPLSTWHQSAKASLFRRVDSLFPPSTSPWVKAMLFGDRTLLPPEDIRAFRRSGLAHVLAVSGLHVGILFAAVSMFASSLVSRLHLPRIHQRALLGSVLALLGLGYGILLGWPASASRALLMLLLAAVLRWSGRPGWVQRTWMMALFLFLVSRPEKMVHDLGAQLSFAAVGGLCGAHLLLPASLRGWRRATAGSVAAGATAFLATGPFLLETVGWLPLGAVLTGLVGIPVTSFFLVSAFLALILPWGGGAMAAFAHLLMDVLITWAQWGASPWHPMLHAAPNGPLWLAVLATMAVLAAARAWRRSLRIGAVVLVLGTVPLLARDDRMTLTVLDVGQGDAMILETVGSRPLVVDTGPGRAAGRVISDYLAYRDAPIVDLVLSHADRDHTGGRDHVASEWQLGDVYAPWMEGSPGWTLLEAGQSRKPISDMRILVLHPDTPGRENAHSAVLLVAMPGLCILLTGDIPAGVESDLVARWGRLWNETPMRILKVAHHGSSSSSSQALVEAFRPNLALFSAGKDNPFGHPHPEVVARFASTSIPLHGTQGQGALQVRWNGQNMDLYRWMDDGWHLVPDSGSLSVR